MDTETSDTSKIKNAVQIHPPRFDQYITLVEDHDLSTAITQQTSQAEKLLNSISEEQSHSRYAEGKWTIKEVVQHIIDAERVFTYRALAFARKDSNILPSFDEKSYAAHSGANRRSWKELTEEFLAVRKSTRLLFNSFSAEDLCSTGRASDYETSVAAMAFITLGHAAHHINLIRERYLHR